MRTRHEHGMADGQVVPANDPFIVGGEELMFPADTAGSPWNVYNCRCAMRTVEKEDIEAEPRQIRVRDPVTGKNVVVSDMTYSEWLDWKQSQTVAVEIDKKTLINQQNRGILKEKIETGAVSTNVRVQVQNRHVEGTKEFVNYSAKRAKEGKTPQSVLTLGMDETQKLIEKYSGTGIVEICNQGKANQSIKEYCNAESVVGKYYQDNAYHDTNRFCIFYAKNGSHIVPTSPKEDE